MNLTLFHRLAYRCRRRCLQAGCHRGEQTSLHEATCRQRLILAVCRHRNQTASRQADPTGAMCGKANASGAEGWPVAAACALPARSRRCNRRPTFAGAPSPVPLVRRTSDEVEP